MATRRDIHQNPELGNREVRTGALVADRLRALGLEVRHPVAKTGVVGILRGGRPGPVVAVRADLDALPIQERNDVPYKSRNDGVKHACGHDAHTAIVLGAAEVLSKMKDRLPGTVVFLFQPAEEGPPEGEEGGAQLMLKEGVLRRSEGAGDLRPAHGSGARPWATWAGRSAPSLRPPTPSPSRSAGKKTHGAYPHTGIDPIPVAAEIVQALQLIVSRQIDAQNPKVLTIGSIQGGNRHNIIADSVTMKGTMRTLDARVRQDMKDRIARVVAGVAEANGTTATLRFVDDGQPPTRNEAALTRASVPSLQRVYGAEHTREVAPQMGAEDFAQFAERVPALYVKMGVRNEARGITAMIHTEDFDIDEAVLPLGVRAVATLVFDHLARGGVAPAAKP